MKRNPFRINVSTRLGAITRPLFATLFLLFFGIAAGRAQTQQQVVFQITDQIIQNGSSVSGSSAQLLPAAFAYSYSISGSCHFTGDLAMAFGSGELSIADALDDLDESANPPYSSYLEGTVVNPSGTLPFTVLDKTVGGTFADGFADASAEIEVNVDATGRAFFSVDNVTFEFFGSPDSSQIVIDTATVTTTAVLTPVTVTGTASVVTGTSATLNASVNPNGADTVVEFQYGLSSSYTATTTPQVIPLGTSLTPVNAPITGLEAGMLYHFRVTGSNATGLTTGSDATFETPGGAAEAPTSVTGTASGIGTNTATLNGTVNPNGNDTKVTFQYGLTTSYTGTTSAQDIGSGTSAVPVTAPLTGLISGTLYHFLVTGSNAGGVTTGGDQTFTTVSTVAAPSVTTLSATNVTSSTANMNGSVNPNGADTIVTFNYGTSNTYGFTTAPQDIGSGTSAVAVTAPLVGLPAGQLYYYQVTGSNSQGAVSGSQLTFMTSGTGIAFAPIVTTNAATVTGTGTAVLHASVNPNGSPSTAYFEYGSGTNYGTTTTAVSIGSGAAPVLVSSTLTGLQPGGTYHFAAVGSSLNGIVTGSDQTFTTDFSFKAAAGKYAAVFSEDTFDTTGLATITVTAKGSFTASIKIEGKTLSFSGKFGSDGSASASHLGTTVQLQLGTTGGNNSVNIEISGLFSADAVAIELLTTKMTAASYTVRIPHPATGYPLGNGYGTLTVGKTGAIRLTGELGDGTPFTASGGMLANMTWPLYAQVYSKKGAVAGTVTFENTVNGNLDGVVNWFKPATTGAYDPLPFDPPAQVNLYGSLYAKPAKGAPVITSTNGDIVFAAGNLGTSPLDIAATLSTANKFAFPTPPTDKLTISITTSNGLFTGSFVDPTSGKKREFHGALFQGDLNFGTGVFKGTTEAGSVDIFPPL